MMREAHTGAKGIAQVQVAWCWKKERRRLAKSPKLVSKLQAVHRRLLALVGRATGHSDVTARLGFILRVSTPQRGRVGAQFFGRVGRLRVDKHTEKRVFI